MGSDDDAVLVLGASSLVGRFLLPQVERDSVAYIALTRSNRASAAWAKGDLSQPATLANVGRFERVFSLSPIWLLPPALPALRDLGMRRLVAFSSTSRFTKSTSASSEERRVAAALAEGEAAVEAFCATNGIGYTILRPTLIYAEGQDGNVSRLAALIQRYGFLPLPGEGRGLRQPVHAEDLAALARLAMDETPTNTAYNATGGETLSYRAMVERIFEGLGRKPRILSLPEPLLRAGYAVARPLLPGSSAQMLDRINQDLVFDGDPARQSFGWLPRPFHPEFR